VRRYGQAVADYQVDPTVRELSATLLPRAEELALGMADRIRAEVPLYAEGQFVSVEELNASCIDNLRYVLGNLAGQRAVRPDVPHATGAERAERGLPYAALLQAYRIGGRYIWELLVAAADSSVREQLLRAAADIWAVTDDLSAQVTDGYRATLADRAQRDVQVRSALLGTLLDGDVDVAEQLWESAAVLRLPRTADFVVVVAECPSRGAEALPGIEELLRRKNVTSAWRLDRDHQEGLIGLSSAYGVDRLVGDLESLTRGRVGVSPTFSRIDGAHHARREARAAGASASPATTEVVRFEDRPLAVLLAGTPEGAHALARAVLGPALDLPPEDRKVLLETARTWLADAGSTSAAAERLHIHRNTVRYRLQRLEDLSRRDLSEPIGAAEVHVALECVRILGVG
jgi:PucR C-terminal helix-turn-helix domain/GGDEF-like domain